VRLDLAWGSKEERDLVKDLTVFSEATGDLGGTCCWVMGADFGVSCAATWIINHKKSIRIVPRKLFSAICSKQSRARLQKQSNLINTSILYNDILEFLINSTYVTMINFGKDLRKFHLMNFGGNGLHLLHSERFLQHPCKFTKVSITILRARNQRTQNVIKHFHNQNSEQRIPSVFTRKTNP